MTYPDGRKYTKDHEWIELAGDRGRVGITDYAQQQLGDVVYVELPEVGAKLKAGQSFGTIESVKAVSELYAPVAGEVVEVNAALKDKPEAVNANPHASWMIVVRLTDPAEVGRAARRGPVHAARESIVSKDLEPGTFQSRHIGPDDAEAREMLAAIGASSLDALDRRGDPGAHPARQGARICPTGMPEHEFLRELRSIAARNQLFKSYIGLGYYDCVTPSVILRNVLENPGWYTPYTPYQAEIAQGRLEALLNFQTMVRDLTGDGGRDGVAARRSHRGRRSDDDAAPRPGPPDRARRRRRRSSSWPTPVSRRRSTCCARGPNRSASSWSSATRAASGSTDRMFGALLQTPDEAGVVHDLRDVIADARRGGRRSSRSPPISSA